MKLKPPADATDFKRKFIERSRRRTGRPSQAKATGCGDLKRDKIWTQIGQGIFDTEEASTYKLFINWGEFVNPYAHLWKPWHPWMER